MASLAPLTASLINDPMYGGVYKKMLDGGSWFDADQDFWNIRSSELYVELVAVLNHKATKASVEKANSLLAGLENCARQIVAETLTPSILLLKARVQAWTPPPAAPPRAPLRNNFAALAESDEE
jgi:hypothetical protein